MHAVLVTFHSTAQLADVEPAFIDHARALAAMPGSVCATWMRAGARVGSYQVFADRRAAERYLGGDLFRWIKANAAFSDFEIRHFEVIDTLSRLAEMPPAHPAVLDDR